MRLIALMVVRNEDWIIDCSLRTALLWCDHVVVVDHGSIDGTPHIVKEIQCEMPDRITYRRYEDTKQWDEMSIRQWSLDLGRAEGGTHFAMVDADEIPTYTALRHLRDRTLELSPGHVLCVPMIPVWGSLLHRRVDDCVWARAKLSVSFADRKDLYWKIPKGAYQHHDRNPKNTAGNVFIPEDLIKGGVMHMQFADRRRILSKHILYRMVDHLRWPNRETVDQLNSKYDQALDEKGLRRELLPKEWIEDLPRYNEISLTRRPWHDEEIKRLLKDNGREWFLGLDLKGF